MQSQQQVKRREKRKEERGGERRGEQPINKNKRTKAREKRAQKNRKTEKTENSGAIAPCVAVLEAFNWRRSAVSVGNVHTNGITPALVSS